MVKWKKPISLHYWPSGVDQRNSLKIKIWQAKHLLQKRFKQSFSFWVSVTQTVTEGLKVVVFQTNAASTNCTAWWWQHYAVVQFWNQQNCILFLVKSISSAWMRYNIDSAANNGRLRFNLSGNRQFQNQYWMYFNWFPVPHEDLFLDKEKDVEVDEEIKDINYLQTANTSLWGKLLI